MIESKRRAIPGALRLMAAGCVAGALLTVAGCNAPEKSSAAPNPAPTAVPGGGKKEDYQAGMQRVLEQQRGGAAPAAPGGAPTAPK